MSREPNTTKRFGQGRYEVLDVLGRGHFSNVFKAYDTNSDKQVALKVLGIGDADRDIAEAMFAKEVDALSGFKHNHVVKLLDHFVDKTTGAFCIVLELIPNAISLDKLVKEIAAGRHEAFDLGWLLQQLKQLVFVLDHAHTRRVVHRDVKPANLLFGGHVGAETIRLADFGVARLLEHYGRATSITLPHFVSVPYAAPEQLSQTGTTYASDLYAFGVTAAALITLRLPTKTLAGDHLEEVLEGVAIALEPAGAGDIGRKLIEDLVHVDPVHRPPAQVVVHVLDSLIQRVKPRPQVGLDVTRSARDKIEGFGLTVSEFLKDLNTHTVASYEENVIDEEKKVNVNFYGTSVRGLTVVDRVDPERLVLVDARLDQPHLHKRRRESNLVRICRYELIEGKPSAYDLLNEFYEYHVVDNRSRKRFETKRELLASGMYILDRLEEEATELIIGYRQSENQPFDDILMLEVDYVRPAGSDGQLTAGVFDSDVIEGWIDGLDKETAIGLKRPGKRTPLGLGRIRDYNGYTHELTVQLSTQRQIPAQGELECQNVAQIASNRRQRLAVDRLLADSTVNPRLGDILVDPNLNSIGSREPIELVQALEPKSEIQDIVEHALAAEDIYLIQGPPGTGKTTLITELVLQILKVHPTARILITAQANPAVDNAIERIREVAKQSDFDIRTLRLARSKTSRSLTEFEDSYKAWAEAVSMEAGNNLQSLRATLDKESFTRVSEAIENWREKIQWASDVRQDYAHSVSVYGVTCLMTPTLWELLNQVEFDWVIVDEAAKATDTEVLVPLVHGKRFVLVGDQRQLPPYIHTNIERRMVADGFDRSSMRTSLFEKLFDAVPVTNRTTLQRQFRMHSTLADFVGDLFYEDIGGLETGLADEERSIALDWASKYAHRAFWIDIPTGKEEQVEGGTSFFNQSEAVRVNAVLEQFNSELQKKNVFYTVGVITPYIAQVDVLRSQIVPSSNTWTNLDIEVSTVDSFQGRENDITMYSMVRTAPGKLRFVEDEKRLNVSLSRAKRLLMMFGHKDTALSSSVFSRALSLLPPSNIITGGSNGSN